MNTSILFISKYYKNFLKNFYNIYPEPYSSYSSIFEKLMKCRYFFSNYYSNEFEKLGFFSNQVVVDAKLIQLKWAQDHGIVVNPQNWYFEIIFAQIKFYKPEIVYIQDWAPELGANFIREIKNRYQFIKIIVGYYGGVEPDESYFAEHDIVVCCDIGANEKLKYKGINAYHIYHAFSPEVLNEINEMQSYNSNDEKVVGGNLAFFGRIALKQNAHISRAKFLSSLSLKISFVIHGIIEYDLSKNLLGRIISKIDKEYFFLHFIEKNIFGKSAFSKKKEKIIIDNAVVKLLPLIREQYFGIEMFRMMKKYKMLLNIHSSKSSFAANLRLFESTGIGSCLITDWKKNIRNLFDPDKEIVTYKNIDEAIDKITFLQNNPNEIFSLSAAAQKKVIKNHTYKNRAADINQIFNDFLKRKYKKSI